MAENEKSEKRANFERLGEKRIEAVREKLRVLGHLGNTSSYEYDDEDVERIFSELQDDVDATRAKFEDALRKQRRRGRRPPGRGTVAGRATLIR